MWSLLLSDKMSRDPCSASAMRLSSLPAEALLCCFRDAATQHASTGWHAPATRSFPNSRDAAMSRPGDLPIDTISYAGGHPCRAQPITVLKC